MSSSIPTPTQLKPAEIANEHLERQHQHDPIDTFSRFEKLRQSPTRSEIQQQQQRSDEETLAIAELNTLEHGEGRAFANAHLASIKQKQQSSPTRLAAAGQMLKSLFTSSAATSSAADSKKPSAASKLPILGVGVAAHYNLSHEQELSLKHESHARGGFVGHLSADYDLHRRCALPPSQARFEAGIIFAPLLSGNISSGDRNKPSAADQRVVPSSFVGSSSPQHSDVSSLMTGDHEGSWSDASSTPQAHGAKPLSAAEREAARRELVSIYSDTDFYNLAAEYDLHRKCPLPPAQARFESNVIGTTDWTVVRQQLADLQKTYPHLGINDEALKAVTQRLPVA